MQSLQELAFIAHIKQKLASDEGQREVADAQKKFDAIRANPRGTYTNKMMLDIRPDVSMQNLPFDKIDEIFELNESVFHVEFTRREDYGSEEIEDYLYVQYYARTRTEQEYAFIEHINRLLESDEGQLAIANARLLSSSRGSPFVKHVPDIDITAGFPDVPTIESFDGFIANGRKFHLNVQKMQDGSGMNVRLWFE
jgi:hypothetical protein